MNELVDLVTKKTGIPADKAQMAVNVVVDFLKKRLPAPIAGQIDNVLSGSGAMKTAQDFLGNMGKKK